MDRNIVIINTPVINSRSFNLNDTEWIYVAFEHVKLIWNANQYLDNTFAQYVKWKFRPNSTRDRMKQQQQQNEKKVM